MTQACVSLDEVLLAAAARAASLVPETSGYLALAVADATSRLPYQHDDRAVLLTVDGSVMVPRKGAVAPPAEAGRGLRDLLRRLLAASTGSMPGLTSAGRPRSEEIDVDRVVMDIEAALIPVNRAAAKRALARLARETLRAKELGKLRKKPSQAPSAAASPPAPPAPAAQPAPRQRTAAPSAAPAPAPQKREIWTGGLEPAAPTVQTEARPPEVAPRAEVAPRVEIAPPALVIAPRVEIAPPAVVIAPIVQVGSPEMPAVMPAPAPAPRLEIAPPALVTAPFIAAAEPTPPAPTPTPFHVEIALDLDEPTGAPAPAHPAEAACSEPALTHEPDAEPEGDATILDPEAMAVIEAAYRPSTDASHAGTLTPSPAHVTSPPPNESTGDDSLTRPWRPVVQVVERADLVHTPTASASHAVLLDELGGSRADELLDAFQPQDHGDRSLAAAASSLRALAGVDLTQPPRAAASRSYAAETPSYLRASAPAPSRVDDDLEISPLPPPRAIPASASRWPLALFAVGVLVLFAAWLYRPTLARDFLGLRQLLGAQPAQQPAAPPHAPPALAIPNDAAPVSPAAAAAEAPAATATPPRARDARASGAADGQHRRRD